MKGIDKNSIKISNGELNEAVINNMIYSKDYDDKKFHCQKKIESKSKWCDLNKTRINLLDFCDSRIFSYKEWVKKTILMMILV